MTSSDRPVNTRRACRRTAAVWRYVLCMSSSSTLKVFPQGAQLMRSRNLPCIRQDHRSCQAFLCETHLLSLDNSKPLRVAYRFSSATQVSPFVKFVAVNRQSNQHVSIQQPHYRESSASNSISTTSAEVKRSRPLDTGNPRLLEATVNGPTSFALPRRRSARNRSNSSFCSDGKESAAALISARVLMSMKISQPAEIRNKKSEVRDRSANQKAAGVIDHAAEHLADCAAQRSKLSVSLRCDATTVPAELMSSDPSKSFPPQCGNNQSLTTVPNRSELGSE